MSGADVSGADVSGADAMPDITVIGIVQGSFPASDAESMALAAEVLRLRDRADALYMGLVAALQATGVYDVVDPEGYDVTPERVVAAVQEVRARADGAEAARDALRAAVREYVAANVALAGVTITSPYSRYVEAEGRLDAARERLRTLAGEGDTRGRIFAALSVERQRQDARWGEQNHPDVDRVLTSRDGGCTPARMAMEHLVARASVARQACEVAAARGQVTWAHILVEEVAELVEAATLAQQGQGPHEDVDKELVQVAAVCVSWLESRARRRAIALAGEG